MTYSRATVIGVLDVFCALCGIILAILLWTTAASVAVVAAAGIAGYLLGLTSGFRAMIAREQPSKDELST